MLVNRERVLPNDALDQLASSLLTEVRSQHPQKPLGDPIGDLRDDVGTKISWLGCWMPTTKLWPMAATSERSAVL